MRLFGENNNSEQYELVVDVVEVEQDGCNKFISQEFNSTLDYQWGRWVFLLDDNNFARDVCVRAVGTGICYVAEVNAVDCQMFSVSLYVYGCDIMSHMAVLDFILDNEFLHRDSYSRLSGVIFKSVSESYSDEKLSVLKLDDFIDTYSCAWQPRFTDSDLLRLFGAGSDLHKIWFLGQYSGLLRKWGIIES